MMLGVVRHVPHQQSNRRPGKRRPRVGQAVAVPAASGVLGNQQGSQYRLGQQNRQEPKDQSGMKAERDRDGGGQVDQQLRRHRQGDVAPRAVRHERQIAHQAEG